MKISSKIALSIFILVLILASAGAVFLYIIAKNDIQKSIYNHLVTAAVSRRNHIETFLESKEESAITLAKSNVFTDILTANDKDADYAFKFNQTLVWIKNVQQELKKHIYEIILMDKKGKIVISSNESRIGVDWSNDDCFLNGSKTTSIEDAYYAEESGIDSIGIASPIKDKRGELLGVVACWLNLDALNEITTDRTGLGKTGEIYIVNKYGYMITPSKFIKDTFLKQKVDSIYVNNALLYTDKEYALDSKKLINIYSNYRGARVLGIHELIPKMQWLVLAEIETKEVFTPLAKLELIFLIIMILIPFIAWVMGMSIAKLITNPLHKLSEGTKIIGAGNLNYKVGIDAKDEVGQLSRAFDAMTADLQKSTVSVNVLDKEKKRFQDVALNTGEWIWEIDSQGIYTYTNPVVERILGYAPEEITGKYFYEFFRSDEREELKKEMSNAFDRKEPFRNLINRSVRKDGREVVLETSGVIVFDAEGKFAGYRGVIRDITERKHSEEELKAAYKQLQSTQAQLVQSAKMASLGILAGGVAHEINNPLTGVLNNVQLIKMGADMKSGFKPADFKELLEAIEESALRCKKITQTLLDFSHASKGSLQTLSLNEIVEIVSSLIEHELKLQNIVIQKDLQSTLPQVLGDHQLLQQVILDIITNAQWAIKKKFEKEGGTITLKTRYEPEKKQVCITILDNGIGIKKEDMLNIFEPFFTTKEVGEGTGLGLSIVYKIVKAHSGDIEVDSEAGKWTAFKIIIPAI